MGKVQFAAKSAFGRGDAAGSGAASGTTALAGDGELDEVIRLSEAIKGVANHARQLYLSSLNAMFSARRAGRRAVGFSAMTTELRAFSQRVSDHMASMAERIDRAVQQVSALQKQRRMQAVTRAAVVAGGAECPRLAAFLERAEHRTAGYARTVAETRQALREQLRRTLLLCRAGQHLAVQAKMEATCAETAEDAAELAQVAEQVGLSVAAIERTIGAEYRHLKD